MIVAARRRILQRHIGSEQKGEMTVMDFARARHCRFIVACVLALGAFGTSSLYAAPVYYSQLFTEALAGPFPPVSDSDDTGLQLSTDTLGPQTTTVQGATGATATAFASVIDGVLHASASGVGGPSFFDGWNATALPTFGDTLTFVSASLAKGTSVQLAFAIDLDYAISGGCAIDESRARVRAQLHTFSVVDDTCDQFDVNQGSGVLSVKIGDELPFQAVLEAFAGGPGLPQNAAFADAANTFRFTIDPIGDFSYVTASGNSYLTKATVPEPATLLLVGAGFVVVAVRDRRRRSSARA
jgi:hypothetical protein